MPVSMGCGSLAVSYNMIDLTMFERMDCRVEAHLSRQFATYQEYTITNVWADDAWEFTLDLVHEQHESANQTYAEVVVSKSVTISYHKLYPGQSSFEKLVKGLDAALSSYYIVQQRGENIHLIAKEKGKTPSLRIPKLYLRDISRISFDLIETQPGQDTSVYVGKEKRHWLHIPKTTQGPGYQPLQIGDRVYVIDDIDGRSWTHSRKVVGVETNAPCSCDIVKLDLPIDRIYANHLREAGVGLRRPAKDVNNYTAAFDSTKLYLRRRDFTEYLDKRAVSTGRCHIPIGNAWDTQHIVPKIIEQFLWNCENPHLSSHNHKMEFFGGYFHWSDFKDLLQPIYDDIGEYLCDHLFILTSNKNRPEYLLHIDYDHQQKDMPVSGALTWPALNCNHDTTTVFYDAYYNGKQFYQFGHQDIVIDDPAIELREKDRCHLSTAEWNSIILKNSDWHTVYNNANQEDTRMLLQWRFRPDMTWEQISDVWKSCSQYSSRID